MTTTTIVNFNCQTANTLRNGRSGSSAENNFQFCHVARSRHGAWQQQTRGNIKRKLV